MGSILCWTTAEKSCDRKGTRELESVAGYTVSAHPKVVRLVEIEASRANAQIARYAARSHLAVGEAEYGRFVVLGLVSERDYANECAHRGQTADARGR
jgi:hypothetical protein